MKFSTKFKAKRWLQLINYGWKDAKTIARESGKPRIAIFFDIISTFRKYHLFSNQYRKERFWELSAEKKKSVGETLGKANLDRDLWIIENYEEWAFTAKWSQMRYESSPKLVEKRKKAYTDKYGIGKGLAVQYGVQIHREHFLPGTVSIGKNVLLAKNVFIDFSGEVIIEDNVRLTNGVIIETHHHPFHSEYTQSRDLVLPTSLRICEGSVLGSRCIILSSCHYIGRHARIGAGAVITKDVPDYAVVVGVPGKIVRYMKSAT